VSFTCVRCSGKSATVGRFNYLGASEYREADIFGRVLVYALLAHAVLLGASLTAYARLVIFNYFCIILLHAIPCSMTVQILITCLNIYICFYIYVVGLHCTVAP